MLQCDSSEPDLCDLGCNGVQMTRPSVISKAGGLEREKDYCYTRSDGKCKFDKSKIMLQFRTSVLCLWMRVKMLLTSYNMGHWQVSKR
jgi:hypothetical protein